MKKIKKYKLYDIDGDFICTVQLSEIIFLFGFDAEKINDINIINTILKKKDHFIKL